MRQIWISKAGPPEVLVAKEAPDPQPAAGETRIRVEAGGVNFADVMGRLGLYPDLPPIPVVPGYEVAGRVDVVGRGRDPSWVGRDVFALTRIGDAQFAMSREQEEIEYAELARTGFSYILPVLRRRRIGGKPATEAVI